MSASSHGSIDYEEHRGVQAAFISDGSAYVIIAIISLVQLIRIIRRYKPWTVQKMVHMLLFIAACLRAFFLMLVGTDWCHALSGQISVSECSTGEREVFYILDQTPIVFFFVAYALLVQFWAEVYYNAVDEIAVYQSFFKPALHIFIGLVMCVQVLFWIFYASAWRGERAFFTKSQAVLNMEMYLLATALFLFYGRRAYVQLRNVPIELGLRSRKMKELTSISIVCSTCFILRCGLEIMFSREKQQLHDKATWLLVLIYYAFLELAPSIAILYFNRRLPLPPRTASTPKRSRVNLASRLKKRTKPRDDEMLASLLENEE